MPRDPELDAQMAECRDLLRDVRGATKDLHAATKLARDAFKGLAEEQMTPVIVQELARYTAMVDTQIQEATKAVFARFETLTNLLLTGRKRPAKTTVDFNVEDFIRDNFGPGPR